MRQMYSFEDMCWGPFVDGASYRVFMLASQWPCFVLKLKLNFSTPTCTCGDRHPFWRVGVRLKFGGAQLGLSTNLQRLAGQLLHMVNFGYEIFPEVHVDLVSRGCYCRR